MRATFRSTVSVFAALLSLVVLAPSPARAQTRHRVLILGDSVFSVFRWAPASQQPLWKHGYDVVNEAWGCQALLTAGCPGSGGKSALERLIDHRGDRIDVIVVGTGYNDVDEGTLRQGMKKIVTEARRTGIPVVWATYVEGGNVRKKARAFNAVVRSEASHHDNVTVAEWGAHAKGHRKWFNGDSIHLNGAGGRQLGIFLAAELDNCLAAQDGG